MKRSGPIQRKAPLRAKSPMKRGSAPKASKGMKGATPTAAESRFHDQLASLGCIACFMDGRRNMEVSIHHIDGRTKPGAHMKVLPLCAGHHQDGTGIPGLIAVHPWKRRFEKQYGKQMEILQLCHELLERAA